MKACSRHAGNRCSNRELYELNAMITKGFFAFSGYLTMPYQSRNLGKCMQSCAVATMLHRNEVPIYDTAQKAFNR